MNSIISKIVIPFTLLLLVVVGVLAVVNYNSTRDALTDAANQNLLAAANQTANNLRSYLNNTADLLVFEVEANQSSFSSYLEISEDTRRGSIQEQIVQVQLEDLSEQREGIAYVLLDRSGKVWIDSSRTVAEAEALPKSLSLDLTDPGYLNMVMLTGVPYISQVIFSPDFNEPVIFFVARVRNNAGVPIGMVYAVHPASSLQEELTVSKGLAGEDSFPVLVDENMLRLGHGAGVASLYSFVVPPDAEEISQLIEERRAPADVRNQTSATYPDFEAGLATARDEPFFTTSESSTENEFNSAAAVYLAETGWTVVYMVPQSTFLEPVNSQARNTLFLALGVGVLAVIAAVIMGRAIARPIHELTEVAEKVATGDVNVRAKIKTGLLAAPNELGTLALAFNVMNARQRQARDELEARVDARTADLAKVSEQMRNRAAQLQTVSEIARAVASEQELEQLLPLITRTISERFDFYHVGIFLLDETKEYAVLRAANSEGGQLMLARNHKLRVGQVGIIGFVTSQGQPRLALDVGKDAVFFDNPDLPLTRSEVGLPLKFRGEVIGALDAQSTQAAAFTQEDVTLLTTLADQVAIAIENARLFGETRRALAELQVSQRDYLQEEWSRLLENRQQVGFRYQQGLLTPLSTNFEQAETDLWNSLETEGFIVRRGEDLSSVLEKQIGSALLVPIMLRGQVLGLIDLHESDPDRIWADEEISMARSVAEQVGLALENARLIEETQRRAEREHLVAAITTRLRASNDPQEILKTAAAELRQALQARVAQVIVQPKGAPKEQ